LNITLLDKIFLNFILNSLIERWKIGSFAKLGLCVGLCGFANVPMCGWLKLFLKCAVGKE